MQEQLWIADRVHAARAPVLVLKSGFPSHRYVRKWDRYERHKKLPDSESECRMPRSFLFVVASLLSRTVAFATEGVTRPCGTGGPGGDRSRQVLRITLAVLFLMSGGSMGAEGPVYRVKHRFSEVWTGLRSEVSSFDVLNWVNPRT